MKFSRLFTLLDDCLNVVARLVQPLLLLVLRLWWGWSFFLTGKGKLLHLDRTAEYFASLTIPLPKLNALMAGSVECVGGLLLMLGLGTRLAAVPLTFTLIVAYATAEREALFSILSDTDRFTGAAPFLFLLATVTLFAFGPSPLSLDAWLRRRKPSSTVPIAPAASEAPAALSR